MKQKQGRTAQMWIPNRGVRTFAATRPGWTPAKPMTHTNYYNAGVVAAYGRNQRSNGRLHMGDLFNDIMGTVVPGWDARPEWMKKIVVKPDPAKLVTMAQKVAPNAAGQIVSAAERNGFNLFYQTPAGQMPITPDMAQGMYSNYPMFARAQQTFSDIPSSVWMIGAAGLLGIILLAKR